ncbi:major histocompatibility complex class I-related gene protein-like [Melanotaenia boesemani]|uniref:major histocompatibility complex class I-related gene protein-like n=1 Tax=Melanotaenia boesemani TaxID=1250792 RepID=UPI001C03D78F|nr:major histocompatibility complex class I-related gene protein-like [Melanotaenia boesemani]
MTEHVILVHPTVEHSLRFFFIASSGVPNFPEFLSSMEIDETEVAYCNISKSILEPKQDWVTKLLNENRYIMEMMSNECFEKLPIIFKAALNGVMQSFKQNEGVHILQLISGCELDENTGEVSGFLRAGYNGDDFMTLDMTTLSWTSQQTQAVIIKQIWDADKGYIKENKKFYMLICPKWLRGSLTLANISKERTDLPKISLLQKTPSSAVSYHATGFYPDRAMMFWTKDGEETHKGVDHGEILLNYDVTFQMCVNIDLSSFTPEDWSRYSCVFQLSGVKDDIIIKLDKGVIRTNWGKMEVRIIIF